MSEWCQNKECCYKRNQNQMRGSKGNKYYQSNKAHTSTMICSVVRVAFILGLKQIKILA